MPNDTLSRDPEPSPFERLPEATQRALLRAARGKPGIAVVARVTGLDSDGGWVMVPLKGGGFRQVAYASVAGRFRMWGL